MRGSRGAIARIGVVAGVALGIWAPASAAGLPPPAARPVSTLHLEFKSAVAGTALNVSRSGLAGKHTIVTVGGRRAKVLSGNTRRVRIVIPQVSPGVRQVVARTPTKTLTGTLRVLPPFDGKIDITPDTLRASSAMIGPGGGTVSARGANGIAYALVIPVGAIPADTQITVTPAAKIGGLPLTGGGAGGVTFAPEHLQLAQDATLRITYPSKPPAQTLGFTFDSATGRSFEIQGAVSSGRTLEVQIAHFSGGGTAGITEADFAAIVQPALNQPGPLTLVQVDSLLDTIDLFTDTFGKSFCSSQPTCGQTQQLIQTTIGGMAPIDPFQYTCNPNAGMEEIHHLIVFEERWQRADGPPAAVSHLQDCRYKILQHLIQNVRCDDPFAASPDPLKGADFPTADINNDSVVSFAEIAVFWAVEADKEGFSDLADTAKATYETCIRKVLELGTKRCDDDLADGKRILETGFAIVGRLPIGTVSNDYLDAIDKCVEKISVTPPQATIGPGATLSLTAKSNVPDGVLWSATAGTIRTTGTFDQNATYTVPDAPGTYAITAALADFPAATADASVDVTCPPQPASAESNRPTPLAESNGPARAPESNDQCQHVAVSINPPTVTLGAGGTQQFAATVTGTADTAVTWSASGGSISNSGLYTAGQTSGTFQVTARSNQSPTSSASATVTVNDLSVTVSPATVTLNPGQTQQFIAQVVNASNPAVTWSASRGSITQTGLFTADGGKGVGRVTATSVQDPSKSGSATVNLPNGVPHVSLRAFVSDSPGAAGSGAPISYSITITNNGPDDLPANDQPASDGDQLADGGYRVDFFMHDQLQGDDFGTTTCDPQQAHVLFDAGIPAGGQTTAQVTSTCTIDDPAHFQFGRVKLDFEVQPRSNAMQAPDGSTGDEGIAPNVVIFH